MFRRVLIGGLVLLAACGGRHPDPPNNVQFLGTTGATYFTEVKPLVDAHCTTCHYAGGVGPFALTTYDEVVAVAQLVKTVVETRQMPPFSAAPAVRPLQFDHSFSDEEIATIVGWVDAGTPMGDPEEEGAPIDLPVDSLRRVDLTLGMDDVFTPSMDKGTDVYRCFVIDWPETEPKYITGFSMRPGNLRIAHHSVAFLVSPDQVSGVESADGMDGRPGYDCFGGPTPPGGELVPATFVAAWTPGSGALTFAEGSGMLVEPGSKLVLQMHYNLIGTDGGEVDQTEIDFSLTDEVERPGGNMPWLDVAWLDGDSMTIPAGDSAATHEFAAEATTYPLLGQFVPGLNPTEGLRIHSILPHMHKLGTRFTVSVDRVNGLTEELLHIENWDFDWQRFYVFEEPAVINPGDRLRMRCEWDNTMANQPMVDGARVQPRDVTWGEGTLDEMCVAAMYVTGIATGISECAEHGSVASDTGRFEVTFDALVRGNPNIEGELLAPVRGAIYRAEDVSLMGPRDGTSPVADFEYDELDLREGPAGPFLIDTELPAGEYQFLGWMDTDGNADATFPEPDVNDPVMIPAQAVTLGCEVQPVTATFAILLPDL